LDYIVQSQHNQKCPLISKDISFLKGGQFYPAWTDHFGRQKVVNLLRRRLDILSGVSTDIPSAVLKRYIGKGWLSWGDWLGTNFVDLNNRKYLPFNEARDFVQKLHINSARQWLKYSASGVRPINIPGRPGNEYKGDGWTGYGDFLGTDNKFKGDIVYRSFEEARAFAHSLNIKTYPEWKKYTKTKEMPKDIPHSPLHVYKEKGWKDCGDWLGTNSVYTGKKGNSKYLPFDEARTFVRTLKLLNKEDWWEYCQLENKPKNIPPEPQSYYNGKGWLGFDDWLGTMSLK